MVHMAKLGEELGALGVELVSLAECIDTTTPMGRALFGICGVFAQLEADLVRVRTTAGLEAARARGAQIGRPRALDARQLARVRRMHRSGRSLRHMAGILNCSANTVLRAVRGRR